jgi:hypothetical protein
MVFPWNINGPATMNEGIIQYSIRFFRINDTGSSLNLLYSLSTLPAESQILPCLENENSEIMKAEYDIPVDRYNYLIQQLNDNKTYWSIL